MKNPLSDDGLNDNTLAFPLFANVKSEYAIVLSWIMYDMAFILSKNDFSVNIFFGLTPDLLKGRDLTLAVK